MFRDLGFSDFEDALSRSYREWEYWLEREKAILKKATALLMSDELDRTR